MYKSVFSPWVVCVVLLILLSCAGPLRAELKRTPAGHPDLSGTYDTGILTSTQRPQWLGETEYLYPWVANALNWIIAHRPMIEIRKKVVGPRSESIKFLMGSGTAELFFSTRQLRRL